MRPFLQTKPVNDTLEIITHPVPLVVSESVVIGCDMWLVLIEASLNRYLT
ncbi:MAG: hypothetical protein ACK5YR_07465 [Pirellula sp.]|jgi:hypothetical protein